MNVNPPLPEFIQLEITSILHARPATQGNKRKSRKSQDPRIRAVKEKLTRIEESLQRMEQRQRNISRFFCGCL
jgi:hypothetical protein